MSGGARKNSVSVAANGRLTLRGVVELRDELLAALAAADSVAISVDPDEPIDVAGAQLLVAAYRQAVKEIEEASAGAAETGSDGRAIKLPKKTPVTFRTFCDRAGLDISSAPSEVHDA